MINIPVLPTFARKINNGEKAGLTPTRGRGEEGGERSERAREHSVYGVLIQRRRFVTAENFHRPNPPIIPCLSILRSQQPAHRRRCACHAQVYNPFSKTSRTPRVVFADRESQSDVHTFRPGTMRRLRATASTPPRSSRYFRIAIGIMVPPSRYRIEKKNMYSENEP